MSMTTLRDQHQMPARPEPTTVTLSRRRPIPWDQAVLHLILIIIALSAVLPLVWCFFASFKHFRELVSSTDLLPHVWTLDNYKAVFGLASLWSGFHNTIIVTTSVTAATVFTSA